MLAYIFWHRPQPQVDRKLYEESTVRFQRDLARQPPPGFIAAASFQIEAAPWLGDRPGYEDWYFVEASWALDPLNGFAISGHMQPAHDKVAGLMAEGQGGLYAHAGGDMLPTVRSTVYWLTRPRGIRWQPPLDALRAQCPRATVWRRQMVLGPATEFAVEAPHGTDVEIPPGWQARRIQRLRLSDASP